MGELADRRLSTSTSASTSTAASAEEDRRLAAEDRRRAAHYLYAAYRDDMTGALHRRPGREQMQALLDRARRDASALTFAFVDVDGLKLVNDSQGHDAGDALLAAVGAALRSSLRSYDLVVRYGGDEFVCAFPGATVDVAQESLARVSSTLHGLVHDATISAGYAELRPTDDVDDVIRRADRDLYQARGAGRPRLSPVVPQPSAENGAVACGSCGSLIQLAPDSIRLPSGEALRRADAR